MMLRCFELVSELKVNFHKSRLFGVNMDETFQKDAANFLNYKNGELPFKFLGLPIGTKPRKEST